MRQARLGVDSEFSTKADLNSMPRRANRSMLGVGASLDMALPYALMVCMEWSSHMIYNMLGRTAMACFAVLTGYVASSGHLGWLVSLVCAIALSAVVAKARAGNMVSEMLDGRFIFV